MSRVDHLNKILRSLQSGSPDVEASALISEDGLMIASALPAHVDETRVAGMSATLLSLGTRAATELERGDVLEVLVSCKHCELCVCVCVCVCVFDWNLREAGEMARTL